MHNDVSEVRGITLWEWENCAEDLKKEIDMSFFSDAWDWIKGAFEDAWNWLKGGLEDAWNWLKEEIGEAILDFFKDLIVSEIKDEFDIDVGMSGAALTVEDAPDDFDQVVFGYDVTTHQAQDGKELFKFGDESTGDIYLGQADTITDFNASEDKISIPEGLVFSGSTTSSSPPTGTYSVWQKDGDYVVTWEKETGGWSDIIVKGDNPLGAIISATKEKNLVVAGTDEQLLNGTDVEDVFVVTSEAAGHSSSDQEKVIENFDPEDDVIILPDGLVNNGSASSAGLGQFVVYEASEMYSAVELDPWDAMYWNIPQAPEGKFVVEWNNGNGPSQILVDEDPTGKVFSGLDAVS